jgi:hypothetical protein
MTWRWTAESVIPSLVAMGLLGYLVGAASHAAPRAATRPAASAATSPPTSAPAPSQWTVGANLPAGTLVNLHDQPAHLARGTQGTVIVEMATWCLFCGYTDRYDVPQWARQPGWVVDVVDVNGDGGIANPGPISPPFHGQDHVAGPEPRAQRVQTLAAYAAQYGIAADAHFYVATTATIAAWAPQAYPTLITLNAQGRVSSVTPGAIPATEADAWLASHGSTG